MRVSNNSARIAIFVLALSVVLAFILFPFSPSAGDLRAGEEAAQTLVSPRAISFESAVQTESRREAAADDVAPTIELDPAVHEEQLLALDEFLADVGEIRASGETLNEQQQRFRDLGQESLADTEGVIILGLPEGDWAAVEAESRRLLDETLTQSISDDQLENVQSGVGNRVAPELSPLAAAATTEIVTAFVAPNVVENEEATAAAREAAREQVEPVIVDLAEGEVIIRQGEIITEATLEQLRQAGLLSSDVDIEDVVGVSLLSLIAALSIGAYLFYMQPPTLASDRRVMMVLFAVSAVVLAAKLYLPEILPDTDRHFLMFILPVAAAPMLVAALFEDTPFALLIAAVTAGLCAFTAYYLPESPGAFQGRPLDSVVLFSGYFFGGAAGVFAVNRVSSINQYLVAGVIVTLATAGGAYAVALLDPARVAEDALWILLTSAAGGTLAAVITLGAFVALGAVFGITTRFQLMEMADLDHPLIRRLQEEAPGTFHHSVLVSNLAVGAANAIGADSLQARIGAYFHDVGKLSKPRYYIENMGDGRNPHSELEPVASARIISDHVRLGLDLARKSGVPAILREYIPQHHGTRLVTYFYRQAVQTGEPVDVERFRYPGPKPQRRETAIVMLADSIEAMVRAREDKSAEAIDFAVEAIIRERLQESQLDESDLTLRDLQRIADSFKATLRGVYHQRIEYPEPTEEEQRALDEGSEVRPDPFSNIS
ncbi:MAG TPA: HDIG domain-containing protein [Dehalococcoidia bacterium]|nr:HDIG domain-containing protein [Dehalococcoidia bacterium]